MKYSGIAALACLAVAGCDSSFKSTNSFPSPKKAFVVDVSTELQGANDSEPWWQHISFRTAESDQIGGRGNFLIYSSPSPPQIIWKDETHLEIVAKDVGDTFEALQRPKELDRVDLKIVVEWRFKKTEQGAAANP